MSFNVAPSILQPLIVSGKAIGFATQRHYVVPPKTSFSVTQLPDKPEKVWILTSFAFSRLRDYTTGEEVYSTFDEPISLAFECQGSYRRYEIEALRSLLGRPVHCLVVVTRTYPLKITVSNQSSRYVEGDSTSTWLEIDSGVWERFKEEKGWNP